MLGDHRRWTKLVPYQASIGVPLVVAGPGVQTGLHHQPATLLDLPATILDWAGAPALADADSLSLAPFLSGAGAYPRSVVRSSYSSWRCAFDGRYKLIRGYTEEPGHGVPADQSFANSSSGQLLFDLETNPGETVNRASSDPATVNRLAPHLTYA
jgi:arylsulfatase A-like enzyme